MTDTLLTTISNDVLVIKNIVFFSFSLGFLGLIVWFLRKDLKL